MFTPLSLGRYLPAISTETDSFNLGWQQLLIAYPITILHHFTQGTLHVHHATKFLLMKCSHWSGLLGNLKNGAYSTVKPFRFSALPFFLSGICIWWMESWQASCDHKLTSTALKRYRRVLVVLIYINSINCLSLVPSLYERKKKPRTQHLSKAMFIIGICF